jgi:hypothetical protein
VAVDAPTKPARPVPMLQPIPFLGPDRLAPEIRLSWLQWLIHRHAPCFGVWGMSKATWSSTAASGLGTRATLLPALLLASTALAQRVDATSMGQGFFDYAKPYVIWAGAAMVLLCVAAAAFLKQFLKEALLTAGIVVMLVFLFNTFPDLVRALSR